MTDRELLEIIYYDLDPESYEDAESMYAELVAIKKLIDEHFTK